MTDTLGLTAWGSDTGGEFTESMSSGPQVAAKGPIVAVKARLPTTAAREQTANSEFATSVGSFDGQAAKPL